MAAGERGGGWMRKSGSLRYASMAFKTSQDIITVVVWDDLLLEDCQEYSHNRKFLRRRIGRGAANPGYHVWTSSSSQFRSVEHRREVLDSLSL
jgi:hypothetical protein